MIDHELIERCRKGERAAQHEIYVQTAERVYRLLVRIVGNADQALDLAQDTYIRAFTRIGQFDGRASFTTWLTRIAINEALQYLRRNTTAKIVYAHPEDIEAKGADANRATDVRLDIDAALAELSPMDRTILVLRYQEGLDYQTIAAATDSPAGTVASRLNRARQRLGDLLSDYGGKEENDVSAHPISAEKRRNAKTLK